MFVFRMPITDEANQRATNGLRGWVTFEVAIFYDSFLILCLTNLIFVLRHNIHLHEMISKDISGYVDNDDFFRHLSLHTLTSFNVKNVQVLAILKLI